MIKDVVYKKLKVLKDDRGALFEILRSDNDFFKKFGQAYITCCNPGWVKGWHYHKIQYDTFCCVQGKVKVVLIDYRKDSETKGEINEFVLDSEEPAILQIPPSVVHGFECLSKIQARILNIPSELYNYQHPDEYRIPLNSDEINYLPWKNKKGY
jgi:dTDP-4-dehydrorhamnose 3,5-epimerase